MINTRTNKTHIAAAVFTLAQIALFIVLLLSYYLSLRLENSRFVQVAQGALRPIVAQLRQDGIDLCDLDLWLIRAFGLPKYGTIDIGSANATRLDFYYGLINGKAAFDNITLIPGETTAIALDQIAAQLKLDADKLREVYEKTAPFAEGVLIPDTYQIIKGSSEEQVANLLVERSIKLHKARAIERFGIYDETEWFRIVTIASIVQKEAASVAEMPLVASVIYNRLDKNMRLQMDGTLNYGYFSHQRVTPQRIKADESDFNTYKKEGLPPYPIAMASLEAIGAALNPAKTKYLYFVRGSDGEHDFSETFREHRRYIREGAK
ncbi:MAG: endolytic transglycosylase MltG [Helicobacteraceae bacterium]|jgi:UPF0755 protein|nr:endolytic transglycosylase MltG [Helicobacteraceae bacterium]